MNSAFLWIFVALLLLAINTNSVESIPQLIGSRNNEPPTPTQQAYSDFYTRVKQNLGNGSFFRESFKNNFASTRNLPCTAKAVLTFNGKYYDTFFNRTDDQAFIAYVKTYDAVERGRGRLNERSLNQFQSLGDIHLIRRHAEFVGLSYCKNETAIQKHSGLNMRTGNYTVLKTGMDEKGNVFYYSAYDNQTNTLVFVFRGSVTGMDAFVDFTTFPIPNNATVLPIPALNNQTLYQSMNITTLPEPKKRTNTNNTNMAEPFVHAGFYARFEVEQKNVTTALLESLQLIHRTYPDRNNVSFVVVGHSLGAAWAFLQAADWSARGYQISALYVYGMPKVGNQAFVDILADQIGVDRIVRVVNKWDLVPHIGYSPEGAHPSRVYEYFLDRKGRLKQCVGGADKRCSAGYGCLRWSWHPHSEVGTMSMREDFCRIDDVTPSAIYAVN